MNALGSQWLGGIITLQSNILKFKVLLHEAALENFPMATKEVLAITFFLLLCVFIQYYTILLLKALNLSFLQFDLYRIDRVSTFSLFKALL